MSSFFFAYEIELLALIASDCREHAPTLLKLRFYFSNEFFKFDLWGF